MNSFSVLFTAESRVFLCLGRQMLWLWETVKTDFSQLLTFTSDFRFLKLEEKYQRAFDWKIKRWGNCFENQKRRLDLKLKWNWPRKVEMEMILKWSQKGNISYWKVNEIRRGFSQREGLNWLEMKWSYVEINQRENWVWQVHLGKTSDCEGNEISRDSHLQLDNPFIGRGWLFGQLNVHLT